MKLRFFSVLDGKKVLSTILIICVIPAMFNGCGKYVRRYFYAVEKGVTFLGSDMGGLLPEEINAVVSSQAEHLRMKPVNSVRDNETGGVIPGLNGYEVDIDATVAAILTAKKGDKVEPLFREIFPEVTLADYREAAVYRGNQEKNQVTFLVNVAWGNEYLEEMLDVLRGMDAEATFFFVGRWVRQNSELAEMIKNAGFELANHGDSDAVSMGSLGLEAAREQIRKGADSIEAACGVRPVFFSPHKGEINEIVLKAAALENSRVIMWTLDTVDWMLPGVDRMLEKILQNVSGGSLILMHPTAQTPDFLSQAIPALREKGLEPVSLSALLCPSRLQREGVRAP